MNVGVGVPHGLTPGNRYTSSTVTFAASPSCTLNFARIRSRHPHMPDSDQTDSNASPAGNSDTQSAILESASGSDTSNEPVALRFLSWLGVSVVLAILAGVLFSAMPARFRLLGLLGMVQGAAVGAVIGKIARPFKLHYAKLAVFGGFVAGAASVVITAILWWQGWAEQLEQSTKPRPAAAMAAHMLAQMKQPDDADPEQIKAYEESRRQFSEFLDAEAAPPESNFTAWLAHRASLLKTGPTEAIAIGLLELLLAGAASSFIARAGANSPFCLECQSWRHVVRSHSFPAPISGPLADLLLELAEVTCEHADVVTAQLTACECEARPIIDIQIARQDQLHKLSNIDLSEQQFSHLKRLLDEAQGMS